MPKLYNDYSNYKNIKNTMFPENIPENPIKSLYDRVNDPLADHFNWLNQIANLDVDHFIHVAPCQVFGLVIIAKTLLYGSSPVILGLFANTLLLYFKNIR